MSKVKIGTIQMSCVADKQQNLEKAIKNIRGLYKLSEQSTKVLNQTRVLISSVCKSYLPHYISVI